MEKNIKIILDYGIYLWASLVASISLAILIFIMFELFKNIGGKK